MSTPTPTDPREEPSETGMPCASDHGVKVLLAEDKEPIDPKDTEIAKLAAENAELKAKLERCGEAINLHIEIEATLRAELEAQKQWRNEAEGKLIECGREIANHVTELEAANAREEFLKSKGLTVGMLTESGKEPHLAYVIEPESELCDLRYIHENLDLKRELEATRKERDQWREQHDTADRSHFRVLQQRDTALAAKDDAERERDRLNNLSRGLANGLRDAVSLLENAHEAIRNGVASPDWETVEAEMKGFDMLLKTATIPRSYPLTPAPTQEPPAGGVTISNDSSIAEGREGCVNPERLSGQMQPGVTVLGDDCSTVDHRENVMPIARTQPCTSENQASPAVTVPNKGGGDASLAPTTIQTGKSINESETSQKSSSETKVMTSSEIASASNSPADVPPEGRGEWMPFNLADALAGKPVVTRDGRKASKIQGDKLLGGTVNGIYYNWYRDGKCTNGNPLHDLFMLPPEGSGA